MKRILMLFISFHLFCSLNAQELNRTIKDVTSGKPILYGNCTRDAFKDPNFSSWYDAEYKKYKVDWEMVKGLPELVRDFSATIVFGSWSAYSQQMVPRFLKILDTIEFPKANIKLVGVDRKMGDGSEAIKKLGIKTVPTIVIYYKSWEVGRIIEKPEMTLEADLEAMVRKVR